MTTLQDIRNEWLALAKGIDFLRVLFNKLLVDEDAYKRLLKTRDAQAQQLLNRITLLLDSGPDFSTKSRQYIAFAMQKLSDETTLYPSCYNLQILPDTPVSSGGLTSIYKAGVNGNAICLKAIKVTKRVDLEKLRKTIQREAITFCQLSHPNILPFYGLYNWNHSIALASPWMACSNISDYLQDQDFTARHNLILDIARGLEYLHNNDIVHGALKPTNILIGNNGRACLTDFLFSRFGAEERLMLTCFSSMNADGFSTRWQAPELYEAKGNDMPRDTRESDIYALGCVSYEVLTGQEPFVGITRDRTIMSKVLQGERPSRPNALNFSWGHWRLIEGIWALLEQCWDAVPVKRPTIGTIVKQFEELLPTCIPEEPKPLDYLSGAQFRSMLIGYGREEIEQSIGLFESLLK